jgi:hypothetical protein
VSNVTDYTSSWTVEKLLSSLELFFLTWHICC